MQKNRRPQSKKAGAPAEDQEDVLAHKLATLTLDLAAQENGASPTNAMKSAKSDSRKLIRKCLRQKKDGALLQALEYAQEAGEDAYLLLKESIEEESGVIVFRRDDGRDLELNAFAVPLFARVNGGLHAEECFQDEEAFSLLRQSFQEDRLESPDATVVLVSHAYHPDEIDRIGYSHLNEMVHDAFNSMTRKKETAALAIGRSMSGWPDNHFAPDDQAVELRFLLGFALKRLDDPFYRVPKDEAAADRYFDARAKRFRHWAQRAAPLVRRCLAAGGRDIEIDFLYQDLFHGAKERGLAEFDTLQMMAELHRALDAHGIAPESTQAVVGSAEVDDEATLRVNLHAGTDRALIASTEKPVSAMRGLQGDIEDACDALMTIGVKSVATAAGFDADGLAVNMRPYKPAG